MCGIVGMIGNQPVAEDVIGALGMLEYRGYDSAGIAVAADGLVVRKVLGGTAGLLPVLGAAASGGQAAIAHTRWATHGRPEERNAHPHVHHGVAVVHNGIIENHAALRAELIAEGEIFLSDTDSEVVPHLIARARRAGATPIEALRQACAQLHGAFALAVLFADDPDRILVARRGSPVMVGCSSTIGAVASDPLALSGMCTRFTALDDGDVADITRGAVAIIDAAGSPAKRVWQNVLDQHLTAELDRFEHHTRREIAEQPVAVHRTEQALVGRVLPPAIAAAQRLVVVACGSSLFAATTMRHALEQLSGIPVDLEIASEYRYRQAPISAGSVALLVSQSGETADALAVLPLFREAGVPVIAIVNVAHSSLARAADLVWPTSAGHEQGVAATKSFTSQMAAMLRLGIAFSVARGRDAVLRAEMEAGLAAAPSICAATEDLEPALAELAQGIATEEEALFIGRCAAAGIAAEAALKLKELSYIRAEAYAAGELKHGPIALIRNGSPVIVFAGGDALLGKTVSNAEEVRARGAYVVAFTDRDGAPAFATVAETVMVLPGRGVAHIFAQAVALQLLSYHAALALGRNVDRPRNLAKSVTVE